MGKNKEILQAGFRATRAGRFAGQQTAAKDFQSTPREPFVHVAARSLGLNNNK